MKATLPLNDQQITDLLIDHKHDQLIVDVKRTIDNDKSFAIVRYLTNLQVCCDIDVNDCDEQTKFDLIDQYLTTYTVFNIGRLTQTLIDILLTYKHFDVDIVGILDSDQIDRYITTHQQQLKNIVQFLDSILVYYQGCAEKFANKDKLIEQYGEIDDSFIVGPNVVNVVLYPEFIQYYAVVDPANFRFYTQQFTNVIFGSHTLESYVFNPNNILSAYFVVNLDPNINKPQ